MDELFNILGEWTWWIVAGVMFVLELITTSFFFLWFGVGAVLTALLMYVVDWGWQGQLAAFTVFSLICLAASRYIAVKRQPESDRPMLNRRDKALVGRKFTLEEPMKNGRGWIRVADSVWQVEGPDLDAGTRVRVASVDSGRVTIERAEDTA